MADLTEVDLHRAAGALSLELERLFASGQAAAALSALERSLTAFFQRGRALTEPGQLDSRTTKIELNGIALHHFEQRASIGDRSIRLTPLELEFAWLLFSNPGVLLSVDFVNRTLWHDKEVLHRRSIQQHAYKIRRLLHLDGRFGLSLVALYRRGYILRVHKPMGII